MESVISVTKCVIMLIGRFMPDRAVADVHKHIEFHIIV